MGNKVLIVALVCAFFGWLYWRRSTGAKDDTATASNIQIGKIGPDINITPANGGAGSQNPAVGSNDAVGRTSSFYNSPTVSTSGGKTTSLP